MEVGLVSCTKSKRARAAQPRELYMESALFRKARQYVEANHDAWYILSAKHHLLKPDGGQIEPYEETLRGAPVARKREWAATVRDQLREEDVLTGRKRLVFHAGQDYYDELQPLLAETEVETSVPTAGLRFGETLAWYNERL